MGSGKTVSLKAHAAGVTSPPASPEPASHLGNTAPWLVAQPVPKSQELASAVPGALVVPPVLVEPLVPIAPPVDVVPPIAEIPPVVLEPPALVEPPVTDVPPVDIEPDTPVAPPELPVATAHKVGWQQPQQF